MRDLSPLVIFTRVADKASFTRAAETLGMHKGRVSTAIRDLEGEVGVRLLHRTTRAVHLTEDGRAFYARAMNLLADAEDLGTMFAKSTGRVRGRLRIDVPTELARAMLIPALPVLLDANPELELELSSTDRRVDIVQEGFDGVLRVGAIGDESLIARPLGALRMVNAASPAYLDRHGIPLSLDDLVAHGHRMIHYTPTLGSKGFGWEYPDGSGYASLALPGSVSVNNVQTYHAAGLAGVGLIQAGLSAMQPYFDSGTMVEILPALPPEPLVVAHRRNLSAKVRTFLAWVGDAMRPFL